MRPSNVEDMFEMDKYTLRFKNARQEDAFNKSRMQLMFLNMTRIAIIGFVAIGGIFLQQLAAVMWGGQVFDTPRKIYFGSLTTLLALCILWGTAPRLERFQQWISWRAMEGICMFMGIVFCVHFLDLAYHVTGALLDSEVQLLPGSTDYHQKSMAVAALGFDAVVTCWHLCLPVRWFVMVWMDVVFIIGFAVSAYTLRDLSPGEVEVHVIIMFSALVIGSCVGLRSAETKDRVLFTTILDERTLRAQAEFNAEIGASQSQRRRPGSQSVETTSTTTFGELVRFAGRGDCQALEEIMALGEKEQWVLDSSQVNISANTALGQGSFGMVVAGEFCQTPVAVKCCKAEKKPGSTGMVVSILNELNVLCRIRHPNIVVFCGAYLNSTLNGSMDLMIVLEKVSGITLRSYVSKLKAWKPDSPHSNQQVQVMKGVCRALIYMHSRRPCIVHSDLKPSNIMVESRASGPFAKLLDFGLSRRATHNATITGGTVNYAAPEAFDPNCMPRPPIDIFATGRLLFFVSSAREPKQSMVQHVDDESASKGPHTHLCWLPKTNLLRAQKPLIEACCAADPKQRPSAQDLYARLTGGPSARAPPMVTFAVGNIGRSRELPGPIDEEEDDTHNDQDDVNHFGTDPPTDGSGAFREGACRSGASATSDDDAKEAKSGSSRRDQRESPRAKSTPHWTEKLQL